MATRSVTKDDLPRIIDLLVEMRSQAIDGHIVAIMLDILETVENFSEHELRELVAADFFNALFVIPRTVGFVAHYLDQKRLDEGLFRLPDDDVLLA